MVEKFQVPIPAFQQDRKVRVFLPKDYDQSDLRYPVLYMHDGQNVFDDEEAIEGVSLGLEAYLNKVGRQLIVVAIDNNPGEERINEYCPWVCGAFCEKLRGKPSPLGGKGAAYADFLVQELKPLIDSKYRTLEHESSIAGISLGALISTYIACRYPGVFKRVAGMSCAFYRNQEEIEQLLKTADLSYVERFYMDCGNDEAWNEEVSAAFLGSNQTVYDILKSKNANVKFEIIDKGKHHYLYFRERVHRVFTYLFD